MVSAILNGTMPRVMRVVPRNRNIEALLLFFVFGINAFELAQIQLSTIAVLRTDFWLYWTPLTAAALVVHAILRRRASEADSLILPIAVFLNGLGVSEIYRLDLAKVAAGATDLFATKQVIWSVVALAACAAVIWFVPSHLFLRRYVFISMVLGIGLLLLPMLPFIGLNINGAQLWIGIAGLTFQPGELAKIALIVFFAGYLVSRKDSLAVVGRTILGVHIPRARELGPILAIWVASLLVLVLQRDLGTSLLYFGLFLVMIYTATGRPIYVVVGLGMFATGALVASQVMDYVAGRFGSWLDPLNAARYDAVGGSYQLVQGMFGLAHGGLFGTGLGGGVPQLVPLAESDFIVTSLGEELGLVGLFAVLACYLLLVQRGMRIAFKHSDDFSRLLAVGLSFVIALQCFIVIGGVTRVVPLTGLTTPLLAAGGSSLLANWMILGLLLRISDTVDAKRGKI
ncbi:MAG: FtsW/RodA/SpoVE family cell cycle protein [Microbacteriaceae bacterium]|nr:FtsW/RodA/SpoVE family cell cycle protein [Microbacteriaceae bacterium]